MSFVKTSFSSALVFLMITFLSGCSAFQKSDPPKNKNQKIDEEVSTATDRNNASTEDPGSQDSQDTGNPEGSDNVEGGKSPVFSLVTEDENGNAMYSFGGDSKAWVEVGEKDVKVILSENGREDVLYEGRNERNDEYIQERIKGMSPDDYFTQETISFYSDFDYPEITGLCPNGDCLIYRVFWGGPASEAGWVVHFYSLQHKKEVYSTWNYFPNDWGFTQDGKYFFECSDSDFTGRKAEVRSVPDFIMVRNITDVKTSNLSTLPIAAGAKNCIYDPTSNTLQYTVVLHDGSQTYSQEMEYSFESDTATER